MMRFSSPRSRAMTGGNSSTERLPTRMVLFIQDNSFGESSYGDLEPFLLLGEMDAVLCLACIGINGYGEVHGVSSSPFEEP